MWERDRQTDRGRKRKIKDDSSLSTEKGKQHCIGSSQGISLMMSTFHIPPSSLFIMGGVWDNSSKPIFFILATPTQNPTYVPWDSKKALCHAPIYSKTSAPLFGAPHKENRGDSGQCPSLPPIPWILRICLSRVLLEGSQDPYSSLLSFLFIYLVAPGLSCNTGDLQSSLQHAGSFVATWGI